MKPWYVSLMCLGTVGLAGCGGGVSDAPVRVFPDAPEPTPFTRAYSMTEAPDGVRVYVQEDGDTTRMFYVLPEGRGWSEPVEVDLPNRGALTGPHFSRSDGKFYFSTNAPFPEREGYGDLNIWRAEYLGQGKFGAAEPLPMPQINTGANETATASSREGEMIIVTNHSRAGGGGYDLMLAREGAEGEWSVETMPEGVNHMLTDDHLAMHPDGEWVIFYSHRMPKFGSSDLWISERGEDGSWQPAENLGGFLNTPEIEFGAGLSWDGETFFFSRNGALFEVPLSAVLSAERTVPE